MTPSRTLSRDYKHVRRNTTGAPVFTGWMGLLIGLSIGLAVALGVYLHYRNPAPEQPTPEATVAPASAQASEPAAPAPADPATEYEFYKMLPEQEVEVPKEARVGTDCCASCGPAWRCDAAGRLVPGTGPGREDAGAACAARHRVADPALHA